jgi:hypothetical protein
MSLNNTQNNLYTEDGLILKNELYMLFVEDNSFLTFVKSLFKKNDRKELNFYKKNIITKLKNEIPFLKHSCNNFYKKKKSKKIIYNIEFFIYHPYNKYIEYIEKSELILKKIQKYCNIFFKNYNKGINEENEILIGINGSSYIID